MNATQVLNAMHDHWTTLMAQYYDSISSSYIEHLAKEYNLDVDELKEKIAPLKDTILKTASASALAVPQPLVSKSTTKKQTKPAVVNSGSVYAAMSRKELIDLCKSNNMPVKRKNQDMIDALEAADPLSKQAKSESQHPTAAAPNDMQCEEIND